MVSILTENPANPQGRQVVIIAISFLSFTWPLLAVRFWVRHRLLSSLGADDAFALLSQIAFTGYCVSLGVVIHLTPGEFPATIAIGEKTVVAFTASETTYALSMLFLKLSLCAFFLRILVSPNQRRVVYLIGALSIITNLYEGIYVVFLCGVPDGHYYLHILSGQCASVQSQAGIAYLQSSVNMATDVALVIIPIWLLWSLEMKASAKVSVLAICVLAVGGCVASMIRFKYIPRILNPGLDFYRVVAPLMIMCIIELGTGLLACSIATLRPLLTMWLDKYESSKYSFSSIFSSKSRDETSKSHDRSMGHEGMRSWGPSKRESNQMQIGDLDMDVELGDIELNSHGQTFLRSAREGSDGSGRSLVGVAM